MLILGIETSCDDTGVAIVEDGKRVLSNLLSSQEEIHRPYSGVVPELASRRHIQVIDQIVQEALTRAGVRFDDLGGVAVTYGPGLIGSLVIGLSFAKAISYANSIPLIGINHLEGHIYASFLCYPRLSPPLLALIVSGGHSELVLMQDHGRYTILGRTRDDAAGEAFDKVAKLLGLGYPGGPLIDQLSKRGNKEAVRFPVARFKKGEYDFSFSGIKTAVLNYLKEKEEVNVEDLAAGFQASVVEALIEKTIKAARAFKIADIILGGGVASNTHLRTELTNRARGLGLRVHFPPAHLCTDNGAMIACAGYFLYKRGRESSLSLDAVANLRLNNGEV